MIIHKETGVTFNNRKDCIKIMGQCRYDKCLSLNGFEFVNESEEKIENK